MASRRTTSRKPLSRAGRARFHSRLRSRAGILALALGVLALAAFAIFLAHRGRLPFVSKPVSEPDRLRIAAHIRTAVERAGGDDAWVKTPPYAPFPPRAGGATEAVVAASHYDDVLAAIAGQAARDHFQLKSYISPAGGHERLTELRCLRSGTECGRWLIREVPKIRHAALVIDDLGQDLEAASKLAQMPYPITFAVLPHLVYSTATAEEAHRAGREVMLHLPMEPDSAVRPGPGEIRVGMSRAEVERLVDEDLRSVPFVSGVNNHMGSRATTDERLMNVVIETLAKRRLFFVDSRTSPESVALDVARRRGVPATYRSIFLDDVETVPYTIGQLRGFLDMIETQDAALAIGHPHPTTLAALERFLPELERHNVRVVPASQLLRLPAISRLSPPPPNGR